MQIINLAKRINKRVSIVYPDINIIVFLYYWANWAVLTKKFTRNKRHDSDISLKTQ